jgi:hypothetical protein
MVETAMKKEERQTYTTSSVVATATTRAFTKSIISFQSTGATNISGVNNLLSVRLYSSIKSRGKGDDKRVWGIEQNEARDLYLSTYWGVDNTDHMIKNTGLRYITWKYWHAPYNHAKAMGIIAAYDMYNECCDGLLDPSWKVEEKDRMTFTIFRQRLGQQMLEYDPRKRSYPGDDQLRVVMGHCRSRLDETAVHAMELLVHEQPLYLRHPSWCA